MVLWSSVQRFALFLLVISYIYVAILWQLLDDFRHTDVSKFEVTVGKCDNIHFMNERMLLSKWYGPKLTKDTRDLIYQESNRYQVSVKFFDIDSYTIIHAEFIWKICLTTVMSSYFDALVENYYFCINSLWEKLYKLYSCKIRIIRSMFSLKSPHSIQLLL